MYKAPSFGLGMKKDLKESIESVYNINNSINEEEQLIISLFEKFLEENFHVEMLTEEDLDYVFEEEFPQWLEEQMTRQDWLEYALNERSLNTSDQQKQLMKMGLYKTSNDKIVDTTGGNDRIKKLVRGNQLRKTSEKKADIINTPRGRNLNTSDVTIKSAKRSASGAPLTKKPTPAPAAKTTPAPAAKTTPGKQVSAKPAARKPAAGNNVRKLAPTKSSVYKPQSRIMKDTGAAAPDFGNNNATFDAENKPVFKSDTETRRSANLRTISKRKRPAPTRRDPTRSWKTTVFEPQN